VTANPGHPHAVKAGGPGDMHLAAGWAVIPENIDVQGMRQVLRIAIDSDRPVTSCRGHMHVQQQEFHTSNEPGAPRFSTARSIHPLVEVDGMPPFTAVTLWLTSTLLPGRDLFSGCVRSSLVTGGRAAVQEISSSRREDRPKH